jgi:hypothetical protein
MEMDGYFSGSCWQGLLPDTTVPNTTVFIIEMDGYFSGSSRLARLTSGYDRCAYFRIRPFLLQDTTVPNTTVFIREGDNCSIYRGSREGARTVPNEGSNPTRLVTWVLFFFFFFFLRIFFFCNREMVAANLGPDSTSPRAHTWPEGDNKIKRSDIRSLGYKNSYFSLSLHNLNHSH